MTAPNGVGAAIGADYPPTAIASGVPGRSMVVRSMPVPDTRQRSWLEYEHPIYARNKAKWAFALAYYTGEVIEPDRVSHFLAKRSVGESDAAFDERCRLADYTNHFAQIVESLAGMVFAVEGDANRTFNDKGGNGLGDPADPRTVIGRLWRCADQEGNGYLTVFKRLAIMLSVTHTCWVMVDAVNGSPLLRVLSPLQVPNWWEGPDGMEVLVKEEVDARSSFRSPPASSVRYVHMHARGWQRYRIRDDGTEEPVDEPGVWSFTSPEQRPTLPIFQVQLPMLRPVGYHLARKAHAIFNKESERDNLLRVANFPRLVLPATDEQFDRITDDLARGANAIQESPEGAAGNSRYITPPTEAAVVASEVLRQKVADFRATAHKEYDDGAGGGAQKTATEVRQDVASGTGAFLQLLKSGLDDAENNALWRIEQIVFPNDRRRWFVAHVDRTDDFAPTDPDAVVQRSAELAWGQAKPVPMGKTALVGIAKEVARHRGVEVVDEEIEAAVVARMILDAMESASTAGLTLPAEVRVELLMRVLASSGLVDAEAEAAMADGSKAKLADVIRARALEQMQAADEAKRREGELLIGGGGAGDDGNGGAGEQRAPGAADALGAAT